MNLLIVRRVDVDVQDADPDEGAGAAGAGHLAAEPLVGGGCFDEVHDDVEGGHAQAGVVGGYGFGEGAFGGFVFEGSWGVEDHPVRHFL